MAKLDMRPAQVRGLEIIANFTAALGERWAPELVYRGHADVSWDPVASGFREGNHGIETKAHLLKWRTLAQRFVSPQPDNDLGYLVLAQHYGVPTPLLDWTTNPLMALFFACQHSDDRVDGEVVQIAREAFHRITRPGSVDLFLDSRPLALLLDTSAMNVRSQAQDSYMSLHTPREGALPVEGIFQIRHAEKHTVRAALELFGLTPERVFVDLNIAARNFIEDLETEFVFS